MRKTVTVLSALAAILFSSAVAAGEEQLCRFDSVFHKWPPYRSLRSTGSAG